MSNKLAKYSGINPEAHPPAYDVYPHNNSSSGPVPRPNSHPQIPGAYPHRAQSLFGTNAASSFTPPHFGPTPLLQSEPTLGLLPYYDPRSPYAIAEATTRAQRRFICASLWAVGIIMLLLAVGAFKGLRDI
ncbi:hypothetical protein AZE42_00414 [Rhizopogon vesiculosus]|uniref:Uncharacterized protein n=1 Tax=Rhizopogon vesiculosus TaxID=180088 RepID=A0A1J8R0Y6_9AGAM|nr:hypothetical protein AZE42_00414 [Rhizopogon vesiculosus]